MSQRQHIKITFGVNDELEGEILIAMLTDLGYEGFEQTDSELYAYIDHAQFDESSLTTATGRSDFQVDVVPAQNWNKLWESNFQPVIVADLCTIRAHFHEIEVATPYEIVITPKMSFGTGHHATTRMMLLLMTDVDFAGKAVLDFGTGTGVLAILAEKLGANEILAIDNDEWSVENAKENVWRNDCKNIAVLQGSLEDNILAETDVILANINRNILLSYMSLLYEQLIAGGHLLMSGLLEEDKKVIVDAASGVGFSLIKVINEGNWIALHVKKTV
jgi:ribosomal protein L11 methyltransferase